ncbi:uncharacterized protein LOC131023580 [Salvia miltiorrhiza]|uniref:uncharacterized protein LOC131023580 n=1 Tax=Salvia miltiorrhiza TaxID=226208 RepID=UPI0025AC8B31|nr:uncharacterized protein LOC131023580 [Salvia miltiorrhiza]
MSPSRIMRKSIFTFLQNFQQLSSAPSLLLLPFAASILLSPPLVASSRLFPLIHGRLRSVFLAAGIPPQSELFAILNLKLAQTILSFAFSLPFSLSFLLLAKAAVIRLLHRHKPNSFLSLISTLNRLVATHICNSLLILSANATCFCLLAAAFNCADVLSLSSPRFRLLLSATGAIAYSIVLANAYIVCGIALIASAVDADGGGGLSSILEACALIRGRTSAALSLAVPMNMALAAVEALFQYRIFNAYSRETAVTPPMVLEAAIIAYIYAMVLILDTIVGYVLLKSLREEQTHFNPQRIDFFRQVKELESVVSI